RLNDLAQPSRNHRTIPNLARECHAIGFSVGTELSAAADRSAASGPTLARGRSVVSEAGGVIYVSFCDWDARIAIATYAAGVRVRGLDPCSRGPDRVGSVYFRFQACGALSP